MSDTPLIKIFATGGTIDKVVYSYKNLDYVVGEPQARRILEQSNVRFEFEIESICKKDSLELTAEDRSLLLEKVKTSYAKKIVITHGTDTITETAKVLKTISNKTIILTGAIFPAKFYDGDANFNLGGAVIAAQILPPGIYLVMNGLVFDPLKVRKNISNNDYEWVE